MNAIGRRLSKLAATLLPQPDTWQMQQLRQRMEAGRKRVSAARHDSVGMDWHSSLPASCGVVERLQAGRARVHEIWKQKLLLAKD
jgi:hypothetical protein